MGKEMMDAGYYPKESDVPMVAEGKTEEGKREKKKRYATINANDLELPLKVKGLSSGDKLRLILEVNVDECTSVDPEKSYNGESARYSLSILKCACEPMLKKSPAEMSDEELKEADKNTKG